MLEVAQQPLNPPHVVVSMIPGRGALDVRGGDLERVLQVVRDVRALERPSDLGGQPRQPRHVEAPSRRGPVGARRAGLARNRCHSDSRQSSRV